ncbi:hypothetical protein NP493_1682g00055 [Ridgeia piscesae]|uniref:Galaxin-like repeats domain-containing protein n=1 Tax=Ridgeia piscesae TaxID=27915 RepID=A0AAD9N7E9_RIDPI|nr:hypothetical protein NP493_1682g00055 [Ridgeia piscesae]
MEKSLVVVLVLVACVNVYASSGYIKCGHGKIPGWVYRCCGGVPRVISKMAADETCCGKSTFRLNSELCCKGAVFALHKGRFCCGNQLYATNDQRCCKGRVVAKEGDGLC